MNKKDLNAISQKANSLIEEENYEKAIEFLNILNVEDPNNYFLKMIDTKLLMTRFPKQDLVWGQKLFLEHYMVVLVGHPDKIH